MNEKQIDIQEARKAMKTTKDKRIRETFTGIKKLLNGEIDHILFQDEAMIRDYQAVSFTWFL